MEKWFTFWGEVLSGGWLDARDTSRGNGLSDYSIDIAPIQGDTYDNSEVFFTDILTMSDIQNIAHTFLLTAETVRLQGRNGYLEFSRCGENILITGVVDSHPKTGFRATNYVKITLKDFVRFFSIDDRVGDLE